VAPQPSEMVLQVAPFATQVVGTHVPQRLAVPLPPQVDGAVQSPQLSVAPQPSEIVPQFRPCAAHVVSEQCPHWFAVA